MKNIFYSGGGGFIGKNFIPYAQNKYHVFAPTHAELDCSNTNAVDSYFNQLNKVDYIIHSTNIGGKRNSKCNHLVALDANLRCFANVFKQRSSVSRFINLGSGSEYARPLAVSKVDESYFEKKIPQDELGLSKLLSTLMVQSEPSDKAVSLQIFGVFGPHEDYQVRFISNAIVRTLFDLPITINQDVKFDYLYIQDCLKIIELFLSHAPKYSYYILGSGVPICLSEIAEIVRSTLGSNNKIIIKNSGLGNEYTCNNDRLKSFLGKDFQFTPIQTAIRELCVYYQSKIDTLDLQLMQNSI